MLKILQKTTNLSSKTSLSFQQYSTILKLLSQSTAINGLKFLHTSQIQFIDQAWRRKMRLTVNPNTESPLTYLPDFSYMDGRPTPLGRNQKKRIEYQQELATKIVQGIEEVDFAIARHERIQKEKDQSRDKIIKNKLKPKGFRLLEKKSEK